MDEFKTVKTKDSNTYNTAYLFDTLSLLDENLKELGVWSVYNNDEFNQEIFEMRNYFEALKKKAYSIGGENLYKVISNKKGGEK